MPYLSVRGDRQREAEEARDEYDFHHEKCGWYCQHCGAGEFDSTRDLKKHEDRCWKNPDVKEEIQKKEVK